MNRIGVKKVKQKGSDTRSDQMRVHVGQFLAKGLSRPREVVLGSEFRGPVTRTEEELEERDTSIGSH